MDDRVRALARLSSERRQKLRKEVLRIEETVGKSQAILFLMLFLMLALTSKSSESIVSNLVDDEMLLHLVEEQGCHLL